MASATISTTNRPAYVWSGSEWVPINDENNIGNYSYVAYSSASPSGPKIGLLWVDADDQVTGSSHTHTDLTDLISASAGFATATGLYNLNNSVSASVTTTNSSLTTLSNNVSTNYLLNTTASTNYLSKAGASSEYLSKVGASAQYINYGSSGQEFIQDLISSLFASASTAGVSVSYDDVNNKISLFVDDDIIPLDDLKWKFDGIESRFYPTYRGEVVNINNPFRLLLTINGIIQTVDFPEYVWQSMLPRDGFMIDSEGYIAFSERPPAGSTFDARIMMGSATTTRNRIYPFRATDIMLGG
jgi:hypothetical protein